MERNHFNKRTVLQNIEMKLIHIVERNHVMTKWFRTIKRFWIHKL